jgi:hypothetical protein
MVYKPKAPSPAVFTSDPSSNPNWMLDHHIMLMVTAEADKDWWRYWVYFKFIMDRLTPYMEVDVRKNLERERALEMDKEYEIGKTAEAQVAKDKLLEQLRNVYIEKHKGYITQNLPRAGIIQLEEEGAIDEDEKDYELLRTLMRAGGASSASLGATVAAHERRLAEREAKAIEKSKADAEKIAAQGDDGKEVKPDEGTQL